MNEHSKWLLVASFVLGGVLHEQPIGLFGSQAECESVLQEQQEINVDSELEVVYTCVKQGETI
jgi:hypothetical protein